MKRRNWTLLQRAKIFLAHGGICHLCEIKIHKNESWDLEHVIPFNMGGADDESNLKPAHKACHKLKTKDDVAAIAKAKRRQAKHLGTKKPKKPWPKRGEWKDNTKNLDGEYVK